MKLKLSDVTLVCVETREHELARMAVEDCLKVAEFGEVLILTDNPLNFGFLPDNTRFHIVKDWPDKLGWSRSWWFDVPPLLRTRQTLNIQWDSWIWDASVWRDEWLDYDYIGAPWWYPTRNVGNGGFSLVSTRLKRYVWKHRDRFPCTTSSDDDLLCRKYRPALEGAGFVWAPERVAYDFSYEGCGPEKPKPPTRHFGFHAMFNWPHVLEKDKLIERLEIAGRSPYIPGSYQHNSLSQLWPELVQELSHQDNVTPIKRSN